MLIDIAQRRPATLASDSPCDVCVRSSWASNDGGVAHQIAEQGATGTPVRDPLEPARRRRRRRRFNGGGGSGGGGGDDARARPLPLWRRDGRARRGRSRTSTPSIASSRDARCARPRRVALALALSRLRRSAHHGEWWDCGLRALHPVQGASCASSTTGGESMSTTRLCEPSVAPDAVYLCERGGCPTALLLNISSISNEYKIVERAAAAD